MLQCVLSFVSHDFLCPTSPDAQPQFAKVMRSNVFCFEDQTACFEQSTVWLLQLDAWFQAYYLHFKPQTSVKRRTRFVQVDSEEFHKWLLHVAKVLALKYWQSQHIELNPGNIWSIPTCSSPMTIRSGECCSAGITEVSFRTLEIVLDNWSYNCHLLAPSLGAIFRSDTRQGMLNIWWFIELDFQGHRAQFFKRSIASLCFYQDLYCRQLPTDLFREMFLASSNVRNNCLK